MWKRTACSMFSPQELCSSSLKKASMSTCHSAGRPVSFLVCLSTVTWWWCCTLKGPVIWMSGADMVPMLPVLSVLLPRSLPPSSERVSADPKPVTIPRTLSDMVCRRALTGRGGLRNPAPGLWKQDQNGTNERTAHVSTHQKREGSTRDTKRRSDEELTEDERDRAKEKQRKERKKTPRCKPFSIQATYRHRRAAAADARLPVIAPRDPRGRRGVGAGLIERVAGRVDRRNARIDANGLLLQARLHRRGRRRRCLAHTIAAAFRLRRAVHGRLRPAQLVLRLKSRPSGQLLGEQFRRHGRRVGRRRRPSRPAPRGRISLGLEGKTRSKRGLWRRGVRRLCPIVFVCRRRGGVFVRHAPRTPAPAASGAWRRYRRAAGWAARPWCCSAGLREAVARAAEMVCRPTGPVAGGRAVALASSALWTPWDSRVHRDAATVALAPLRGVLGGSVARLKKKKPCPKRVLFTTAQ
eukprot:scaffold574_cov246-Pinguiococcus_pyrenoidosus.AAC.13